VNARDDQSLHPNLADALGEDTEHAGDLDAIARRLAALDASDAVDAPPDGLWAAIDAEVSSADAGDTGAPVVDLEARRSRRALLIALGAAAAVLLVVATVATLAAVGRDDEGPTTEQVALAGLPDFEEVSGSATVVVDGRDRSVGVDLTDVEVPAGSHLELWLLDEPVQQLVPLGPLVGDGPHAIPDDVDLEATPIVDVSLEPDDGNPTHSGVSVVRGRIEPA
jgi:anti-sigma-K factor RskA